MIVTLLGSTLARLAIILIATGIMANLGVSVVVFHNAAYKPSQKTVQIGVVWLLPLIGAAAIAFLISARRLKSMSSSPIHPKAGGADQLKTLEEPSLAPVRSEYSPQGR